MFNINLQNFIFNSPDRLSLMDYVPNASRSIRISIYRNHSFELIEHTIAPYLDFAGLKAEFIYSDYDDSLSFFNLDVTTDLLIIWLDTQRYQIDHVEDFIKDRMKALESIYKKPVITAFLGIEQNVDYGLNVINYSFDKYRLILEEDFYDLRLEVLSGTKMSPKLCMSVSKDLGLNYIPALVAPNLKAIVLDLDNTLYQGVLGEDGFQNVQLTDGHTALQRKVKELKKQGYFLCIASKNDKEDVQEMLSKREDFSLKAEDFTQIMCSWDEKANSIFKIAEFLNIGTDSILFVDDNPGELISVNNQIPNIKLLLALPEAEKTLEVLENYPGLLKLRFEFEDSIRSADTSANEQRMQLKSSLNERDYIHSLKINLIFRINNVHQITRISELSNKTNQFIFNYKRFSVAEIKQLIEQPETAVVTVELSDRLSNSGIVGTCVARRCGDAIEIQDCFVSCRALGRGIDELIVKGAIKVAKDHLSADKVHVMFQKGTRNVPAETFVKKHFGAYQECAVEWDYQFPEGLVSIQIKRS